MNMRRGLAVAVSSYGLMKFEVLVYSGMSSKRVRNIKALIIHCGAVVAVSLLGFMYSKLRRKSKEPLPPPRVTSTSDYSDETGFQTEFGGAAVEINAPSSCNLADVYRPKVRIDYSTDDLYLETQCIGDESEFCFPVCDKHVMEDENSRFSNDSKPEVHDLKKVDYENEIRQLRDTVTKLQEQEKHLKNQLEEYYSLKEQQAALMELRNRVKINQMESKLFNLKIESLQKDNKELRNQVSDHANVVLELDTAKSQIKMLKKKLRIECQQNKEMILSLKEKVSRLQEQESEGSVSDPDVQIMIKRLKAFESEVEELKTMNKKLQLENSELAQRLESTQIFANSKPDHAEVTKLKDQGHQLRCENEELKTKVELLQGERCKDLEELVYLRWINACLRYELRNYEPPQGKEVARDLSRTLSPKSEQKAKQLILEYAESEGLEEKGIRAIDFDSDQWSLSPGSCIVDAEELDNAYVSIPSVNRVRHSKKQNILGKLKRVLLGKDAHHDNSVALSERATSSESAHSIRYNSNLGVSNMPQSHYHKLVTPKHLLRHSFDVTRLREDSDDDAYNLGSHQYDFDGTSNVQRRTMMRRHNSVHFSHENQADLNLESTEQHELIKLADALKGSSSQKKWHRRSASYSFEQG